LTDATKLQSALNRIDSRPYPAYRDLKGRWRLGAAVLTLDHVQGDPFASPSRVRVSIPTGLEDLDDPDTRLATADWLLRRFARRMPTQSRGSGRSGRVTIYRPGPEILERSALRLTQDGLAEVRIGVGLPARGRRILGREAWALLSQDVCGAAACLVAESWSVADHAQRDLWVATVRRQRDLRRQLRQEGLVGFIEEGSILPRASGIDAQPLADAVPFEAPSSMRVTLETRAGPVIGMGVRKGVTLIVGGGFHGKSTVLQAIQRGHLDHIPGDGREGVVADMDTVKIRAEDGRRIASVDISPFLRDLPGGRKTRNFSTDDASGSTSQAASIVEAVESGARVLLLDEDTSATNLLVRDERMRALIPREGEPITPLVERIQEIAHLWSVSVVMVVGGVGDFLSVADHVLAMADYRAQDVTQAAKELAGPPPTPPEPLKPLNKRVVHPGSLRAGKIRARDDRAVQYGDHEIVLTAVEQVLDSAHAYTLGQALRFMHDELVDRNLPLPQMLHALQAILDDEGVEVLSPREYPDGLLVRPRRHEVAAALNRLRSLKIQLAEEP
jgi:predicted ABC-class ATPase